MRKLVWPPIVKWTIRLWKQIKETLQKNFRNFIPGLFWVLSESLNFVSYLRIQIFRFIIDRVRKGHFSSITAYKTTS